MPIRNAPTAPQTGREQLGRRPALVLSPREYNRPTGLALLCPITNKVKIYPYEVAIPKSFDVGGVILADQVKNLTGKNAKVLSCARCRLKFSMKCWKNC